MNLIYGAASPFVGHAGRAFTVALLALAVGVLVRRLRRGNRRAGSFKPWLIAAISWMAFGACEAEATRERSDIRLDLLVSWPLLCIVSLCCVGFWLWRTARPVS